MRRRTEFRTLVALNRRNDETDSSSDSSSDSSPQVQISTVDAHVLAVRFESDEIEVQQLSLSTQSIRLDDVVFDLSEVHETTQMILRLCDSGSVARLSGGSSALQTRRAVARRTPSAGDPFHAAQRMLSESDYQREIHAAVQEDSVLRSMIQSLDNGQHTSAGASQVNQLVATTATNNRNSRLMTVFENIAQFLRRLWNSIGNSSGRFASCLRTAITSLMQCIRDAMRIVARGAAAMRGGRYVLPPAAAFIQTCVLAGNADPLAAVCSILLSLMSSIRRRLC